MKTGIFETRRQGKTRGICVQNFQLLLSFRSRKNILVQTGFPKKDASCLKLKNISDLIDDTERKKRNRKFFRNVLWEIAFPKYCNSFLFDGASFKCSHELPRVKNK